MPNALSVLRLALAVLMVAGAGLVTPLSASSASAQTSVEWESLPVFEPFTSNRAAAIGFLDTEDGGFAAIVGRRGVDMWWWHEDSGFWENICPRTYCDAEEMAIRDSVILTGASGGPGSGGALSLDRGETWIEDPFSGSTGNSISALLWSTNPDTDGALYVGQSFRLHRSDDLGQPGTYTELGLVGGQVEALAEMPPSAMLSGGRLLAGVWNGLTTSDDGGETFQPSSLYEQGAISAARSLSTATRSTPMVERSTPGCG